MNDLSGGLILPAIGLAVLAWLVPKGLGMVLMEGVKPLMFNAFASAIFLYAISGALFFLLYVLRGAPVEALVDAGVFANIVYFGRLGLMAALIWLPILILTVANLPRHWKTQTW